MSKKLGLHIAGRRFDVEADESFAPFLEYQISKDFNINGNNDIMVLIRAYVKRSHELFEQEQIIEEIVKKMD